MSRQHHSDYDEQTTKRCERALLTLLGDLGPWRERIYLAGGLAPRYLIGELPEGARGHVGTADVDLVIGLQDRHENKDAYDLVFTLLHFEGGPRSAGRAASASAVAGRPQVVAALGLLEERFREAAQDGPSAYAGFLGTPGDEDEKARLRQEAAATVRTFLRALREAR